MEPDQDDLRQYVMQPRVVLPLRCVRYNVLHSIGLYLDGFSGLEVPVDVPVPIDVPVPVDGHASREQAAAEYELFRQYLVNNDYLHIYRHFCRHVVLLREADFYAYDPLPFPGVDDDV